MTVTEPDAEIGPEVPSPCDLDPRNPQSALEHEFDLSPPRGVIDRDNFGDDNASHFLYLIGLAAKQLVDR